VCVHCAMVLCSSWEVASSTGTRLCSLEHPSHHFANSPFAEFLAYEALRLHPRYPFFKVLGDTLSQGKAILGYAASMREKGGGKSEALVSTLLNDPTMLPTCVNSRSLTPLTRPSPTSFRYCLIE
jgi:hypothetical protein